MAAPAAPAAGAAEVAAAVAAANAEVDACLVTYGLAAANARRFASINGINTIDCFGTLLDAT